MQVITQRITNVGSHYKFNWGESVPLTIELADHVLKFDAWPSTSEIRNTKL
jgi:hypothetical protein